MRVHALSSVLAEWVLGVASGLKRELNDATWPAGLVELRFVESSRVIRRLDELEASLGGHEDEIPRVGGPNESCLMA